MILNREYFKEFDVIELDTLLKKEEKGVKKLKSGLKIINVVFMVFSFFLFINFILELAWIGIYSSFILLMICLFLRIGFLRELIFKEKNINLISSEIYHRLKL